MMRELHQHTKRTARKRHVCSECDITIKPGTVYMLWHGVSDGTGYSEKVCLDCDLVQTGICWSLQDGDDGPYAYNLGRYISDVQDLAKGWSVVGDLGSRRAYIQEALRTMPAKLKARVLAHRDGKPSNPETVLCPLTASAVRMMGG